MRSRRSTHDQVAAVARRRLELLSAELAEIRPDPVPVTPGAAWDRGGSGEPSAPPPPPAHHPTAPRPDHDRPAPLRDLPEPGRHAHRSVGLAASMAGWTQDRLPPTLQGRVRLSSVHLTVLALLVAGALGLTSWWVARADDPGVAVSAGVPATSGAALVTPAGPASPAGAPGSGTSAAGAAVGPAAGAAVGPAGPGSAASASTQQVVVDVAGKVRRPGIVTLPVGARVVDALAAAGGARRGVALTGLNLARVLVDGEQVVVGVPPPAGVAASAASAPGAAAPPGDGLMVSLNSASQAELEELPGIGPVTAQKILAYRTDNGAFSSVDQLLEVSGIGDATLAEVAPFVTL